MFHVSIIVPNATVVAYGFIFGGMHPFATYYTYLCYRIMNLANKIWIILAILIEII